MKAPHICLYVNRVLWALPCHVIVQLFIPPRILIFCTTINISIKNLGFIFYYSFWTVSISKHHPISAFHRIFQYMYKHICTFDVIVWSICRVCLFMYHVRSIGIVFTKTKMSAYIKIYINGQWWLTVAGARADIVCFIIILHMMTMIRFSFEIVMKMVNQLSMWLCVFVCLSRRNFSASKHHRIIYIYICSWIFSNKFIHMFILLILIFIHNWAEKLFLDFRYSSY